MLKIKIVGTEKGLVKDEKVLITDDNKLTIYGCMFILLDILADIGLVFLIHNIVKKLKKGEE